MACGTPAAASSGCAKLSVCVGDRYGVEHLAPWLGCGRKQPAGAGAATRSGQPESSPSLLATTLPAGRPQASSPSCPPPPARPLSLQVRDALRRAAEACGAEVQTGAEVAAITTDPAGARVTGVALADGRRLEADLVVCNRDLAAAYQLLEGLPPGALGAGGDASSSSSEPSSSNGSAAGGSGSSQPSSGRSGGGGVPAPQLSPAAAAYGRQQHERLGRLKYSAGVIAYNWCVGRPLEGLQHHNVFLSQQWREAWRPAGAPDQLVRAPNFYLHCPSRTDPSAAPPGCESVMVLLPVAHEAELEGGQQGGYAALVDAGRRRILQVSGSAGCRLRRVLAPAARLLLLPLVLLLPAPACVARCSRTRPAGCVPAPTHLPALALSIPPHSTAPPCTHPLAPTSSHPAPPTDPGGGRAGRRGCLDPARARHRAARLARALRAAPRRRLWPGARSGPAVAVSSQY